MKKKIALIFGGKSAEHEVSLNSAKNIFNALDKEKFEEFRKIMTEARSRVVELSRDFKDRNSLYHFGFVAFPLSKDPTNAEVNDEEN